MGLIPGSGRPPREGHGNPLQCSCLENSVDKGAWQATVHGVAESWTSPQWLKHTGPRRLFSSLVRRHMPLETALVLVAEEYRFFTKWEQGEHTGISLRAGDLVNDFMAQECLTSYAVPLGIQHLLFLLNEGKHLYRNELDLLIDYLETRKGQVEGIWPCPFSSLFN